MEQGDFFALVGGLDEVVAAAKATYERTKAAIRLKQDRISDWLMMAISTEEDYLQEAAAVITAFDKQKELVDKRIRKFERKRDMAHLAFIKANSAYRNQLIRQVKLHYAANRALEMGDEEQANALYEELNVVSMQVKILYNRVWQKANRLHYFRGQLSLEKEARKAINRSLKEQRKLLNGVMVDADEAVTNWVSVADEVHRVEGWYE